MEETHRTYYKLSDGQIKKLLANNTHYKVYSKVDAERIINNVLSQYMSFGEKYGEISGKSKAEVIDLLWKGLNSAEPGKQMGVALHIADYIIQNSVLESIYSDDDVQIQSAIDIVDALRPYLHSINLDSLKGEIKYRYDKDNSAYLLWGKRKGDKGIGVDTIPQILEEQTYINSLGLKVAQKYMIMGYLGYSNKNGQQQVKSYIQRLSLTKSEKEKLYEYSGYAA